VYFTFGTITSYLWQSENSDERKYLRRTHLENFPDEILLMICEYLDPDDLVRLELVSSSPGVP
jgi:hypothetical protein